MYGAICHMNDILLIVLLVLLIKLIRIRGNFGENKSEINLGRYTSQAEIWSKSSVGYFKDAAELS